MLCTAYFPVYIFEVVAQEIVLNCFLIEMPPNKTNILRKRLSQCNTECSWLGQSVDLAAVIDSGSDLDAADVTTVYVYDWHW